MQAIHYAATGGVHAAAGHYPSDLECTRILMALLKAGCSINAPDAITGMTPMAYAIRAAKPNIVAMMLEQKDCDLTVLVLCAFLTFSSPRLSAHN